MTDGLIGLIGTFGLVFLLMGLVQISRLPASLKVLAIAALAFRVIGAIGRHVVIYQFYGGTADAGVYFNQARQYVERFYAFDFSPFWDQSLWMRPSFWGTQFVTYPTAIVLSFTGPTILGAFIVFSLLSFLGLVGFAIAFRNAYPHVPLKRYVRWIWFFPALWFWPSSIGKEALIMMGLGLSVAGFIWKRDRINVLLLLTGLFFVFAIRPQVAAVVMMSMVVAQWLPAAGGWNFKTISQGVVLGAIGLFGINLSLQQIGVEGFDIEGVQAYMEANTAASTGGSDIEAVGPGITNVPFAMINILFRPFPFEARNVMMAFSAIEILVFWIIVWKRRRHLKFVLRNWRNDRLVKLALVFIVLYSATLGMMVANLGIIARQRVFLFPFLFLLIEAWPVDRKAWADRIRRYHAALRARVFDPRLRGTHAGRPAYGPGYPSIPVRYRS